MAEVQGNLVNFWVRVSGTSNPFKKLICLENSSFEITNDVSVRKTNCGDRTGISDPSFNASGTAVQDPNPDSTSVSYADVKAWQKAKTKLDFNYKNDADSGSGLDVGEGVQSYGSGYFTSSTFNASAEADGLGTYDWTFTGTGTLDNYDGSATS